MALFPKVFQNCLPRLGSDHVPIRLESGIHTPIAHPFRFEQAWCLAENFTDLIKEWWNSTQPSGCGAFVVAKKIMHIKERLKHWAKYEFGSIKLKKLSLLHDLKRWDVARESHPLSTMDSTTETNLKEELGLILKQEEMYWKQRARVTWLKEGDENTGFFHAVANGRRNKNFIPWVLKNNVKVMDIRGIGEVFTSF